MVNDDCCTRPLMSCFKSTSLTLTVEFVIVQYNITIIIMSEPKA